MGRLGEIQEVLGLMLEAPADAIQPDADLFSDLGVDSLGWYNLLLELESRYGIRFGEDDFHTLTTVRMVADRLDRLIAVRSS